MMDIVQISADMVYHELRTLSDRTLKMESKLDDVLKDFQELKEDHEVRIRALEMKVWFVSGICSLVAGAAGTLIPIFMGK